MESTYQYGAHVIANGIRHHYIRYGGKGTPLVLIPGISSPAATWGFIGDRLGRKFDTYVLDMRGRGLSESGDHLDYSLDACAADAVAVADALSLPDYVFLGHSMGARIGIRAARQAESRIKNLVLVDPPVTGPGRRVYPVGLDWILGAIHAAAQGPSPQEMRSFRCQVGLTSIFGCGRSGFPPVTCEQSRFPTEGFMKTTFIPIFGN